MCAEQEVKQQRFKRQSTHAFPLKQISQVPVGSPGAFIRLSQFSLFILRFSFLATQDTSTAIEIRGQIAENETREEHRRHLMALAFTSTLLVPSGRLSLRTQTHTGAHTHTVKWLFFSMLFIYLSKRLIKMCVSHCKLLVSGSQSFKL